MGKRSNGFPLCLFQIDHIDKLDPTFKDWVIVVVRKEVFYPVGFSKPAFFIEWYGKRAVPGPYIHRMARSGIDICQIIYHLFSVAFALTVLVDGNIFQLAGAVISWGNDADTF